MAQYQETRFVTDTRGQSEEKPRVLRYSLPRDEESDFLYFVRRVYEANEDPEDMCTALRNRLEEEFGPTWHVIIGDYFAG